jgi:hypothetical protein
VQGWRYQLSLFANVVANELYSASAVLVDRWFAAWSEPDGAARASACESILANDVSLRDRFSAIEGIADLLEHLAAVHRFMAGITMRRDGDVHHCQGTAIADWVASMADGTERARGTNVFILCPDQRIASITGFWRPPRTTAQQKEQPT